MINDDNICPLRLDEADLLGGGSSAVQRDEKFRLKNLQTTGYSFRRQSVAFIDPMGEKLARFSTVQSQDSSEHCERRYPIDVIVSVKHDPLFAIDGLENPVYPLTDTGQQ